MKMKTNPIKTLLIAFPLLLATSGVAMAADGSPENMEKDNTAINVRDRRDNPSTADQQMLGDKEIEIIAAIRREIVANDELSTYGENVKILRENGKVVLRGPVPNLEEKNWIGQAAKRAAPNVSVVNELEVTTKN